jgi:hypothetical protein
VKWHTDDEVCLAILDFDEGRHRAVEGEFVRLRQARRQDGAGQER